MNRSYSLNSVCPKFIPIREYFDKSVRIFEVLLNLQSTKTVDKKHIDPLIRVAFKSPLANPAKMWSYKNSKS